ncbi:hypothetical protein LAZ67_2003685 [Cordylochernes scorpioides]|uniref:Vacuolar protein sorting-associated protein 13 DH-like domain-containing protein n=1 Tax=Cordylochernes scorpioides TaxID=51811 RepID=A0ABY6K343_9ARAC|nr:hypothetical protein LAZ67_2003685 [Cordylochernes scorpioides]
MNVRCSEDAVDQVLVDSAGSSTALFVLVDSRDNLELNLSYTAIVTVSQIIQVPSSAYIDGGVFTSLSRLIIFTHRHRLSDHPEPFPLRLVANGLHSCRPLRRLPLAPPNRLQRLEWCRARSTWMTEWHRVVFSDESRFCLSSDSRRVRVWRRRGERSNPAAIVERPTVRQRVIMVWGAIVYDSRSPLLRIQGTMTAQRYVDDVLRPVTLPYLQGVPNALYQQDNARPHTARISQQALQDVQMLPWPPYSPDLSPIEHVWDIIGRRLHALPQPRSEDELWQMAEKDEDYKPIEDTQGYHGNPAPNVPNQTMLPLVDVSPADSDSEITVMPSQPCHKISLSGVCGRTRRGTTSWWTLTCATASNGALMIESVVVIIEIELSCLREIKELCEAVFSQLELHPLVGRPLHLLCPKSQLESVGADVDRYSRNPFHQNLVRLALLEPGIPYHVPLLVAYHCRLFLQPLPDLADPTPFDVSSDSLWWQDGSQRNSKLLVCSTSSDPNVKFCIKQGHVQVLYMENIHVESPSVGTKLVPNYTLHILPPVVIHNDLPFPIELEKPGFKATLLEGEKIPVFDIEPSKSQELQVEYGGLPWHGKLEIACDLEEHRPISMACDTAGAVLRQLALSVAVASPNQDVHLFSPYWIVNLTGLPVHIRGASSEVVYETSSEEPLLFRFKKHKKKKAKLQVYESRWSQAFSLDTVASSGVVICLDKERNKKYRMALCQLKMLMMCQFFLDITWASQLSKMVVIKPYFQVSNRTKLDLRFMEENELADLWLDIAPGQSGLTVKVEAQQDAPTTITFLPYSHGDAPVRVDNFCEDLFFKIHQKGQSQVTLLSPYQSVLYTWDDPSLDHTLVWNLYNRKKPGFPSHIDKVRHTPYSGIASSDSTLWAQDGYGSEKLLFCTLRPGSRSRRSPQEPSSSDDDFTSPNAVFPDEEDSEWEGGETLPNKTRKDKVVVHWVSYLEGSQRVLLFTQEDRVAALARKEMEGEGTTLEVFVSMTGAGLSLVTGSGQEIAYAGLRGSPAVWELELNHCWKLLTLELSSWLEDRWRHNQTSASLRDLVTVDLAAMKMTKPVFGRLRRTVSPALWGHLRHSPHYTGLNLKLHRLQIDNQLPDAVFPVVLYPAPTPLAVVRRLGPRPFLEVGLLTAQHPGSAPVVKHLKLLVQEFYLRADKGFLLSVYDLISTMSKPLENQVNFSFSPRGTVYKSVPDPWSFQQDLLEVFLSSVGATLSEMKDVELKMAFFERQGISSTWAAVLSEARSFYTCQVVQQAYVLLLGLDILGNPYGLVKDFTQGLGDFFYEPFLCVCVPPSPVWVQGAVYGPDEFAEGLARGAQSLLGHVVGGTAGSISLVTGSLGQALAALSFDEDYRKKRRMRLNQHPPHLPATLLLAARSFVLGVALGLSGVVIKPITDKGIHGAQQEGVEGFFKGIGKGLMGLITKPAGGVMDMVSMATDGIRRAAELGEHVVVRLRLPRFTNPAQASSTARIWISFKTYLF